MTASPQNDHQPLKPGTEFLRLEGITKAFGGVKALQGVSLSVRAGEIYHLLGENGSGKSTLIKIISGAQPPDGGTLYVRGAPYSRLTALQSLEVGIETVYQDLSLFPNLSVAENVALSAQLVQQGGRLTRPLDWKALRQTAEAALRRVGLQDDSVFLETPVADLPIAVRQLVAIARGIATKATLVIMDEPTAALTQKEVENLIGIVSDLRKDGVSVLFVSHKLDEVFSIGGNLLILRDGQKVAEGELKDYTKSQVAYLMTGKALDQTRYRSSAPQKEGLLEARELGRKGGFEGVSFTLRKGEVLGITGLLDSGRNELALALAGVRPAERGEIRLEGRSIQIKNPSDALRLGLAYVPEDRLTEGLFLQKPIRENIMVSILDELLRGYQLDFAASNEKAWEMVKNLHIATPNVMIPVQSLSGGNQQRVMVARWLATGPKVLILNGPTMGVDVGSKDALYRIIQNLSSQGLGVIIVGDDLPELLQNCDRILVMRRGRLAREFMVSDLSEETLTKELLSETTTL
ncbi:MAG: sugar ABC transporter ATP-binding protein [Thermaceae bacterium]|nr:sugar ABC transporter ATP-binding protein [Thermaceae bacterium]